MWHEYSEPQPCIEALTHAIVSHVQSRLQQAGTYTLALSGGRSPIPLFECLAQADLPWALMRLRLVDERYVPPNHPDSNERLVRQHLLSGAATAADFRALYQESASIEQAVNAANQDAGPIDLAILGMGDDGHMASLFPGAAQLPAALADNAPPYLHVTPPQAPHERISLSLPALRACGHLLLYIAGAHKKKVLRSAESKPDRDLPISLLAAEPGGLPDVYWHP